MDFEVNSIAVNSTSLTPRSRSLSCWTSALASVLRPQQLSVRALQRLQTPLSRPNMLSTALLTLGAALPMRFWTSAA